MRKKYKYIIEIHASNYAFRTFFSLSSSNAKGPMWLYIMLNSKRVLNNWDSFIIFLHHALHFFGSNGNN